MLELSDSSVEDQEEGCDKGADEVDQDEEDADDRVDEADENQDEQYVALKLITLLFNVLEIQCFTYI